MKTKSFIKSINLGSEDVLTLEKAGDRLEFQAFMIFGEMAEKGDCAENWVVCPKYVHCPSDCPPVPPPTPV
ncbi:MAG: hypothetical protein RDU13_08180 [Elusimicrobiales bacterium]|jgi:hypothetical protein|nr:hypothetical protein [Elusimicrobiales bacterium]